MLNVVKSRDESKVIRSFNPVVGDLEKPLVSIAVYNYNYGRYLEECLESIAAQTYTNIEVIFSDNASTDESWEIASSFCERYPGLMTITRNRTNLGPGANLENCMFNARGTYVVPLCSDDAFAPTFVEKCVRAFQQSSRLGFVMVHRDILDEHGQRSPEPPFYNQSCIIDGEDQAAVYMMAAVNPSVSQVMYDKLKLQSTQINIGATASKWYYPRIQDFHLCVQYPMAYINEPLLINRVHGENDSTFAEGNLLEVLGPYVMNIEFAEIAKTNDMDKVYSRLPAAIEKLSTLCLRYCVRFLLNNNEELAQRYFYLAPAMTPKVTSNELFLQLNKYWTATAEEKEKLLQPLKQTQNLVTREVSYDPPESAIPIKCAEGKAS